MPLQEVVTSYLEDIRKLLSAPEEAGCEPEDLHSRCTLVVGGVVSCMYDALMLLVADAASQTSGSNVLRDGKPIKYLLQHKVKHH